MADTRPYAVENRLRKSWIRSATPARHCVLDSGRWISLKRVKLDDLFGKSALKVLIAKTLSHVPTPFSMKKKGFVDET